MHDYIHASIANQRVRDLVEAGDARRASRRAKREQAQAKAAPQAAPPVQLNGQGSRVAAILRLRPWLI